MFVVVSDPEGKVVKKFRAQFKARVEESFNAPASGVYRVECTPRPNAVRIISPTHWLCLLGESGPIRIIATQAEFYFWVPAGTKRFGVKIWGEGLERVNASIVDLAGKVLWSKENIETSEMFVSERPADAPGEFLRLRTTRPTKGAFEDYYIDLRGIPPLLAGSKWDLLKPE